MYVADVANVVSLFIAFLALRGLAFGTIQGYLFAVRAYYMDVTLGAVNPLTHYQVTQVLTGVKQQFGNRPKPKFAILPEYLLAIVGKMGNSPADIRDWALFLLAFWGLLRKSELLAILLGNIVKIAGGLKLWIGDSKTDKNRVGMWVVVAERQDVLCPVRATTRLLESLPANLQIPNTHLALATVRRTWTSKPLAGKSFANRIKFWIQAIGLDPKDYSGHSLRRGGATTMARAGIPADVIQIQGRWRSDAYKLYLQMGIASMLKASAFAL